MVSLRGSGDVGFGGERGSDALGDPSRSKKQETRGKRQEARSKRREARNKRKEARDEEQESRDTKRHKKSRSEGRIFQKAELKV
jgi:hypothetical protein